MTGNMSLSNHIESLCIIVSCYKKLLDKYLDFWAHFGTLSCILFSRLSGQTQMTSHLKRLFQCSYKYRTLKYQWFWFQSFRNKSIQSRKDKFLVENAEILIFQPNGVSVEKNTSDGLETCVCASVGAQQTAG